MSKKYDVAILGGGVVGLTLALLLARDRLRIALVTPARPTAPASPDIRAYALNLAARQLLESLRVWPENADGNGPSPVTPVTRMWVSDASANAALTFEQASNGTYTGNLTGTGTLVKNGSGQLLMTGTSGFTGENSSPSTTAV